MSQPEFRPGDLLIPRTGAPFRTLSPLAFERAFGLWLALRLIWRGDVLVGALGVDCHMALFFDQDWFDHKLRAAGKDRADVAQTLALTAEQVNEIWKDQRELLAHEVAQLAHLLNVTAGEIADRAGAATPVPPEPTADLKEVVARLDELSGRMERLERLVVELKALMLDQARYGDAQGEAEDA